MEKVLFNDGEEKAGEEKATVVLEGFAENKVIRANPWKKNQLGHAFSIA